MNKARRVLISGGGVAGQAAAMWLARGGINVTIVEKAKSNRQGGYLVGLAGQAYQDARDLGVLSTLEAREGGILSSRYLDRSGSALLKLDYRKLFKGVNVVQLMRDDLVDGVYEKAKDMAEFRFGDSVSDLQQDTDGVDVMFASGTSDRFDVVIGADGQNSNIRGIAFQSDDVNPRHLGLMCAAYRLPNVLDLQHMFETHMERQRYMAVFSTRHGDMGAVFIWESKEKKAPLMEMRRPALMAAFDNPPDATALVLKECPREEMFYMDSTLQILMKKWHSGRVILIGDAAHSLTLFSGRGAAAAFADAGYLGRALCEHTVEHAFQAFEKERHHHLRSIQDATRDAVGWYVPRTVSRHFVRNGAMAVLPNRIFEQYFHRKYSTV